MQVKHKMNDNNMSPPPSHFLVSLKLTNVLHFLRIFWKGVCKGMQKLMVLHSIFKECLGKCKEKSTRIPFIVLCENLIVFLNQSIYIYELC